MTATIISLRDTQDVPTKDAATVPSKQAPVSDTCVGEAGALVPLLEEKASRLSRIYKDATALEVIRAAIENEFLGRIAMVSSFGSESAILLKLVSMVNPDIPVIFLDTQKHFSQTLTYRQKLVNELGLTNLVTIEPDPVIIKDDDPTGGLWRHDPDHCCTIRKVNPLIRALEGFDAWFTGRKQFHGGMRMQLPLFDAASPHIKVNPIVNWTPDDVAAFSAEHKLPVHPLVAQGYPSIGCWPCTHPVADGDDMRAGRWRGAAKTECGIHQKK